MVTSFLSKTVVKRFFKILVTVNVTPTLYACQLSYDSNVMILRKVVMLWFTITFSQTDATVKVTLPLEDGGVYYFEHVGRLVGR